MKPNTAKNPEELRKEITANYETFKTDESYRKSCTDRLKSMDMNLKNQYKVPQKGRTS